MVLGGAPGLVQIRLRQDGSSVYAFAPYGASYTGPISVAVGDVNGDGHPDVVTANLSGAPLVRVFDGNAIATGAFDPANPTASLLAQWNPYGTQFDIGAYVAVGDISGNGFADIVTGAGRGNPDVRVYSGQDIAMGHFDPNGASLLQQWFAYGLQFNVGATVAVGPITGSGFADIVTGATQGNPHVKVYRGQDIHDHTFDPDGSILAQWFAYDLQFNVGVNVAVGDVNGDGFADVITGATIGNPDVRVWDGNAIAMGTFDPSTDRLAQFFAYDVNAGIGVAVAAADFEGNGHYDILTGPSRGPANYRVVNGLSSGVKPPAVFEGIAPDFTGGVFVGA